jgi:hypothetical protein
MTRSSTRAIRSGAALDDMTSLARRASAVAVAEVGERQLAEANDPASLLNLAVKPCRMRNIVAEATGKRDDINEIGKLWLKTVRKGGVLLTEMAETGERQKPGDDRSGVDSRAARPSVPTLADMGFSKSRSSNWQLAASLPQAMWALSWQRSRRRMTASWRWGYS